MELNSYNTHRPILEKYIEYTTGDIIEIGIGDGSTGFILDLIKDTDRKLISLENNKSWYDKMVEKYPASEQHIYHFYNDYETEFLSIFEIYKENVFSIAFIDSSPWMSRIAALNYFKDNKKADYVLIHDVDFYPKNNIIGKVIQTYEDREPDLSFVDVSPRNQLYYPPKPYPASTGPPTLIISPTDKDFVKCFEMIYNN